MEKELKYWGVVAPIQETITLFGEEVPVLLEIQDGAAELAILEEAAAVSSVEGQKLQQSISTVARALVQVREDRVTESLADRAALAATWPTTLIDDLSDAYFRARWRIRKERQAMDADPDFGHARSTTGESSVPSAISPINA